MLNSNLHNWILLKTDVALQCRFVEFCPQNLDKLPVVLTALQQGRALEGIAQHAMHDGFDDIKADLNEIVYRLYGMMEEEIDVVEEESRP